MVLKNRKKRELPEFDISADSVFGCGNEKLCFDHKALLCGGSAFIQALPNDEKGAELHNQLCSDTEADSSTDQGSDAAEILNGTETVKRENEAESETNIAKTEDLITKSAAAYFGKGSAAELSGDVPLSALTEAEEAHYRSMGLKEGALCPVCKKGVLIMRGKVGHSYLGCSEFPSCRFGLFVHKTHQVTSLMPLQSRCPQCGSRLEVKAGRYGIFIGCSAYPECGFVYRKEDHEGEKIQCPVCKKGNLLKRITGRGRSFYGCSSYPGCTFLLPGKPVAELCEKCFFPLHYINKTKSGTVKLCGNSMCPTRRKRRRISAMKTA